VRLLAPGNAYEARREAALLLGQFAQEREWKRRIAARNVVPTLVDMLSDPVVSLREMAAFALGRLALDRDAQVGIADAGAVPPLLSLLHSSTAQHMASFALYALAESSENATALVADGVLEATARHDASKLLPSARDCVDKTSSRVIAHVSAPDVMRRLSRMLSAPDPAHRRRAAAALAAHAPALHLHRLMVPEGGLGALLGLLPALSDLAGGGARDAAASCAALSALLDRLDGAPGAPDKAVPTPVAAPASPPEPDAAPGAGAPGAEPAGDAPPPAKRRRVAPGEATPGSCGHAPGPAPDFSLVVCGEPYAPRISRQALARASPYFRALLEGPFAEAASSRVELHGVASREAFEAAMGAVEAAGGDLPGGGRAGDAAPGALRDLPATHGPAAGAEALCLADQWMMPGLKRACEAALARTVEPANMIDMADLAAALDAPALALATLRVALREHPAVAALHAAGPPGAESAGAAASGTVAGPRAASELASHPVAEEGGDADAGGGAGGARDDGLLRRLGAMARAEVEAALARMEGAAEEEERYRREREAERERKEAGEGAGREGAGPGQGGPAHRQRNGFLEMMFPALPRVLFPDGDRPPAGGPDGGSDALQGLRVVGPRGEVRDVGVDPRGRVVGGAGARGSSPATALLQLVLAQLAGAGGGGRGAPEDAPAGDGAGRDRARAPDGGEGGAGARPGARPAAGAPPGAEGAGGGPGTSPRRDGPDGGRAGAAAAPRGREAERRRDLGGMLRTALMMGPMFGVEPLEGREDGDGRRGIMEVVVEIGPNSYRWADALDARRRAGEDNESDMPELEEEME